MITVRGSGARSESFSSRHSGPMPELWNCLDHSSWGTHGEQRIMDGRCRAFLGLRLLGLHAFDQALEAGRTFGQGTARGLLQQAVRFFRHSILHLVSTTIGSRHRG